MNYGRLYDEREGAGQAAHRAGEQDRGGPLGLGGGLHREPEPVGRPREGAHGEAADAAGADPRREGVAPRSAQACATPTSYYDQAQTEMSDPCAVCGWLLGDHVYPEAEGSTSAAEFRAFLLKTQEQLAQARIQGASLRLALKHALIIVEKVSDRGTLLGTSWYVEAKNILGARSDD